MKLSIYTHLNLEEIQSKIKMIFDILKYDLNRWHVFFFYAELPHDNDKVEVLKAVWSINQCRGIDISRGGNLTNSNGKLSSQSLSNYL